MNRRYLTSYGAMAFIVSFGLLTLAVGNAMAAKDTNKGVEQLLDKVSKEGRVAMREVRWARVAIIDGQTQLGEEMLGRAKKELANLAKQSPESVVTIRTKEKIGGKVIANEKTTETNDLVPIDAGLVFAEDYVATPEKQKKIEKANKHLGKGETAKAIAALREADIGVSVSRVFLPVKDTVKHVDKAMELMKAQKYYEANLALKAAEDGAIVNSVLLYDPTSSPQPQPKPKS
jgi:glucan-binding YG repeat protein